jgi:hypothetical protein
MKIISDFKHKQITEAMVGNIRDRFKKLNLLKTITIIEDHVMSQINHII